jgi:thiol-disulfide isomerase/thioredoxin
MNFLDNFKWYNILLIILLIVVTIGIIILPTDNQYASKQCPITCPQKPEQFCQASLPPTQALPKSSNDNFEPSLQKQKPIDLVNAPKPKIDNEPKHELTLFYAMWCGHSRAFLPEWTKFEEWAKNNVDKVRVGSVRCEDGNEATCSQKGVRGYPTVMLYLADGSAHKYEGERTVDGLKQFIGEYVK